MKFVSLSGFVISPDEAVLDADLSEIVQEFDLDVAAGSCIGNTCGGDYGGCSGNACLGNSTCAFNSCGGNYCTGNYCGSNACSGDHCFGFDCGTNWEYPSPNETIG